MPFLHTTSTEHVIVFLQWPVGYSVSLIKDNTVNVTAGNCLSALCNKAQNYDTVSMAQAEASRPPRCYMFSTQFEALKDRLEDTDYGDEDASEDYFLTNVNYPDTP